MLPTAKDLLRSTGKLSLRGAVARTISYQMNRDESQHLPPCVLGVVASSFDIAVQNILNVLLSLLQNTCCQQLHELQFCAALQDLPLSDRCPQRMSTA